MGFRFSKRIKIAPGVSLNLSKSGVSTSIGPRGAKITLGHGRVRTSVGIPGTGVSYTTSEKASESNQSGVVWLFIIGFVVLLLIFSS